MILSANLASLNCRWVPITPYCSSSHNRLHQSNTQTIWPNEQACCSKPGIKSDVTEAHKHRWRGRGSIERLQLSPLKLVAAWPRADIAAPKYGSIASVLARIWSLAQKVCTNKRCMSAQQECRLFCCVRLYGAGRKSHIKRVIATIVSLKLLLNGVPS